MKKTLRKKTNNVHILSYYRAELDIPNIYVHNILPVSYFEYLYSNPLCNFIQGIKIFFQLLKINPDVVFVDLPQEAKWAK